MMSDSFIFGKQYHTEFDPRAYLKAFLSDIDEDDQDQGKLLQFKMECMHKLCALLPQCRTALDLGCGPSIDSVIPLSLKCEKIFMAEYTVASRKEIEKWLDSDKDAHDWSPFFKAYADKAGIANWKQLEEQVRSKIQRPLLFFDASLEKVLPSLEEQNLTVFDVVLSSLCLEAAAASLEDYEKSLKKVADIIHPNGYFLLFGVLEESYYTFGGKRFKCLKLSLKDVQDALDVAGFTINPEGFFHYKRESTPEALDIADCTGCFAVLCKKKGSQNT